MADERRIDHRMAGKRGARGPGRREIPTAKECSIDREVADLAGRQHGVVSRGQLLAMGMSRHAVDLRLKRGWLHLVHRGVFAVGHWRIDGRGRWMAAVLACGSKAVLSHRSAGQLWGMTPRSQSIPELTRPAGCRPRPGIRLHRGVLPGDEVTRIESIPVTTVSRTLLDLAAVLSRHQLERAMNEAEVLRLTDRLPRPMLLDRYRGVEARQPCAPCCGTGCPRGA